MVFMPGFIISLLTFPGVIVHELSHQLFCVWTRVKVHEVCYFRFGNPAGYVVHEGTVNFKQSFLITTGPLIVGTLSAMAFFLSTHYLPNESFFRVFLIWVGGSIAMHAFPSSGDAKNLWKETNFHVRRNFFALLGYPFALIIWTANLLKIIWFDLLYAFVLYWAVAFMVRGV